MKDTLKLISAMLIFGTIGIFRKYIPIPSSSLAMIRGGIGTLFLILVVVIGRQKISFKSIKNNLAILLISGSMIGFNWMLLFESYNHTTVAIATICYYMAPVFVMIVSPIFLKEKLSVKKVVCILVAIVGMLFVSGLFGAREGNTDALGIIFGLGAAALYATVIILNQKIKQVTAYEKSITQLSAAAIVMIPYVFLTEAEVIGEVSVLNVIMILVVGIINTGVAYALYFGSMKTLPAQKIALFGYIDPVVAVLLSAFLLKEKLRLLEIVGIVLVLASTLVSELPFFEKKKTD